MGYPAIGKTPVDAYTKAEVDSAIQVVDDKVDANAVLSTFLVDEVEFNDINLSLGATPVEIAIDPDYNYRIVVIGSEGPNLTFINVSIQLSYNGTYSEGTGYGSSWMLQGSAYSGDYALTTGIYIGTWKGGVSSYFSDLMLRSDNGWAHISGTSCGNEITAGQYTGNISGFSNLTGSPDGIRIFSAENTTTEYLKVQVYRMPNGVA